MFPPHLQDVAMGTGEMLGRRMGAGMVLCLENRPKPEYQCNFQLDLCGILGMWCWII